MDKTKNFRILKKDYIGCVKLYEDNIVVKRPYYRRSGTFMYENEIKWLKILKDTDIAVELLSYEKNGKDKIIRTRYWGEPITKETLPNDWELQRDHIMNTLKEHNCIHNDIKPVEILVRDGKIRLCDFGWAYEYNTENPKEWNHLGNKQEADIVCFNDSVNQFLNSC